LHLYRGAAKATLDPKVSRRFGRKDRHDLPKGRMMNNLVTYTELAGTETPQVCPVLDVDGNIIRLKLPRRTVIGSPVKIEADNTLSLGEVCDCHPEEDGYVVYVELLQSLRQVAELTRLARALLG